MLQISCPWCGVRDETEFTFGGESYVVRPPQPDAVSDQRWAAYLFLRANPKGLHHERWQHSRGCRQWFNMVRHTVTHEIHQVYTMREELPWLQEVRG